MKSKVISLWKKNYVFLIMFCIIGAYHLSMGVDKDSVVFAQVSKTTSYLGYMASRYQEWSSRLLIDAGLLFFPNHLYLWRILDTAIWALMLWGMTKFLDWGYTPQLAGIVCMLFLCFDIQVLDDAGWIATINNYIWPFACFCAFLLILTKLFREGELKWPMGVAGIVFIILAGNQEQMAAALLGVLSLSIMYLVWKKRKISVWFAMYSVTVLANLFYIITCPGNASRMIHETANWFPEFSGLGLWQKLDYGIVPLFHNCMFGENHLFLLFVMTLCMAVQRTKAEKWQKCVAFLPLIGIIMTSYLLDYVARIFPGVIYMRDVISVTGAIESGRKWSIAALLLYAGMFLCIFWALFLIFRDNEKDGLVVTAILGVGFGTRMMMGFSPTVWASGLRTMLFWQMALVLAAAYLWNRNTDDMRKREMRILIFLFAVSRVGKTI